MRKLLLCLSAILCFSVECLDGNNTYFSYINNQWIKTDKDGKPVDENDNEIKSGNKNTKHVFIDATMLYLHLTEDTSTNALVKLNKIINIQHGIANNRQSSTEAPKKEESSTGTTEEKEMIRKLAQHLVDKGHFGYLPMPALTKSRAEDKGQTQGVRLEFNEPRSYFNMSPVLKQCMIKYTELLARKIRLLSDPEQLGNLFKIYKSGETDEHNETDEHKALYDAAYEQMMKEAMELVENIRNNRYTADKVAFDKNCVKILASPIEGFSDKCVEGFALDKKNQEYQQGKRIMLYISTKDGKVKISTIFPGNTLEPLKEKVVFKPQESNK